MKTEAELPRPIPNTGHMLLNALQAYADAFDGSWHLDDDPDDVIWSGERKPNADERRDMRALVDAAVAYFDVLYPKEEAVEGNWGLWLAIETTNFYPELK